jgi:hypothetical protein
VEFDQGRCEDVTEDERQHCHQQEEEQQWEQA